jgi:hypothetical protein
MYGGREVMKRCPCGLLHDPYISKCLSTCPCTRNMLYKGGLGLGFKLTSGYYHEWYDPIFKEMRGKGMKIPMWFLSLFAFLAGVAAAFLAVLSKKPSEPTPADVIVKKAEEEIAKTAADIKADSDEELAKRFNESVKKEEKK